MPITLLYHDVVPAGNDDASGFPGGGAARYKLTIEEFDEHLQALAKVVPGPPATADEILNGTAGTGRWLLTFDDGGLSAHAPIADRLDALGWRAHFLVTADYIGTPTFVGPDEIRDLHRRGHVIGSHSCSHPPRMSACSREQLLDEWRRSRDILTDLLGAPVRCASVPGGHYSREVAHTAATAGLELLFNSEPTTTITQADSLRVLGRYSIYRGMTPAQAAALIAPGGAARFRQTVSWNAKKVAKTIGGRGYLGMRRFLLERRHGR